MKARRVATGVPGLDPLIEGGFPAGKSYLLTGAAGTGKSILCMQFLLKGLADGEKAVYVSVDEKPHDILEHAASLGWDAGKYVKNKQLLILDASAYFIARAGARDKDLDVQKTAADLSGYVKNMEATRVIIDPAGPFVMQGDSTTRAQENMRMLVHSLEENANSTNLLTSYAIADASSAASGVEEYLVEGVLALSISRSQERIVRTLAIRKMRGTAIDLTEYPFTIKKPKGIVLSPLL
ncbi:MAG TPA: ATPase domain-containing protein [Verrucomicrobiae bacterium]|jgi:circadian clock protein KaiC|nr:ATPase domain-containing protein [Verrucomicrobiae bacterium]